MTALSRSLVAAGMAAASLVALGTPGATATAVAPARTSVTLTSDGLDLSGEVRSTRRSCKADRLVVVYKQRGTRGGGDDIRFAQDTTALEGSRWTWSTGNTGTAGRFYAKLPARRGCAAAVSSTVRLEPN